MNTVLSLVLAVLLAAGAAPAAAQPAPLVDAARVLLSEGDTMLVRGNALSTPVRTDVPIRSGDRIRTGADGRVQLRFTDGALISIRPGSDFRVEGYLLDDSRPRSLFELVHGSLRAVSGSIGKEGRGTWRLKTPTATIGIRGTEFTVDEAVCPAAGCAPGVESGLRVAVISGRVNVANAAGSADVPAGATLRMRDAVSPPLVASAPAMPPRAPGVGTRGAPPDPPGVPSWNAPTPAWELR